MGKQILYLLGAGASSEVLPLSVDFAERLRDFANELTEMKLTALPRGLDDNYKI